MGRQKRGASFLDMLEEHFISLSWWSGLVFVAGAYGVIRYLIPASILFAVPRFIHYSPETLVARNEAFAKIYDQMCGTIAPVVAAMLLLLWLVALKKKFDRRHLVDEIRDMESLRRLGWREFETLAGEYFRQRGFSVETRGGAAPDGGVDLVLRSEGQVVLVQCKHWRSYKVGVRPLRELLGVVMHEKATRGMLLTSGEFTGEALAFAAQNPLQLINGHELVKMIHAARTVDAIEEGSNVPDLSSAPLNADPLCPKCGSPMTVRTDRNGSLFLGCTQFPKTNCHGTRSISNQ